MEFHPTAVDLGTPTSFLGPVTTANDTSSAPNVSFWSSDPFLGEGPGPGIDFIDYIVRYTGVYVSPCLLVPNMLGLLIGILALTDPTLRPLTTSHYLLAIFVVELLHMTTRLHDWLSVTMLVDLSLVHVGFWCHLKMFVSFTSQFLSTWFTVFLGIECLEVERFHRAIGRSWRGRVVIMGTVIVAVVVYRNISLWYKVLVTVGPPLCIPLHSYRSVHDMLDYGDIVINAVVPTLIITVTLICRSKVICSHTSQLYQRPGGQANEGAPGREQAPQADDSVSDEHAAHMSELRASFLLLLCHVVLSLPNVVFRSLVMVKHVVLSHDKVWKYGFLTETILKYILLTKCVFELTVLTLAYPTFRMAIRRLPFRFKAFLCQARNSDKDSHRQNPASLVETSQQV